MRRVDGTVREIPAGNPSVLCGREWSAGCQCCGSGFVKQRHIRAVTGDGMRVQACEAWQALVPVAENIG